MLIKRMVVIAALLAVVPGALQAQQPAEARRRIEAAQARIAQAGIPAELLAIKIAEGRAKGVTEERIAVVVERRAAGLIRAQEVLVGAGRRVGPTELAAGADALDAGVDASALRAIIQQARDEDRAVALAVLAELVRQGVPAEQARARVESALARGGQALSSLPRQAAEARERRGPPEGVGRPDGAGRPSGVGGPPAGAPGGPPSGVPAGGQRPGNGGGGGKPPGTPGGKPPGTPGGRP